METMEMLRTEHHDGFALGEVFLKREEGWTRAMAERFAETAQRIYAQGYDAGKLDVDDRYDEGFEEGYEKGHAEGLEEDREEGKD